jgi:hypothetical protein
LDWGITAVAGRAEGSQQARALIAGAKEKREQSVGCGVDKQHTFAACGESAAEGGNKAGFANATGQ